MLKRDVVVVGGVLVSVHWGLDMEIVRMLFVSV